LPEQFFHEIELQTGKISAKEKVWLIAKYFSETKFQLQKTSETIYRNQA